MKSSSQETFWNQFDRSAWTSLIFASSAGLGVLVIFFGLVAFNSANPVTQDQTESPQVTTYALDGESDSIASLNHQPSPVDQTARSRVSKSGPQKKQAGEEANKNKANNVKHRKELVDDPVTFTADHIEQHLKNLGMNIPDKGIQSSFSISKAGVVDGSMSWGNLSRPHGSPQSRSGTKFTQQIYRIENQTRKATLHVTIEEGRFLFFAPRNLSSSQVMNHLLGELNAELLKFKRSNRRGKTEFKNVCLQITSAGSLLSSKTMPHISPAQRKEYGMANHAELATSKVSRPRNAKGQLLGRWKTANRTYNFRRDGYIGVRLQGNTIFMAEPQGIFCSRPIGGGYEMKFRIDDADEKKIRFRVYETHSNRHADFHARIEFISKDEVRFIKTRNPSELASIGMEENTILTRIK